MNAHSGRSPAGFNIGWILGIGVLVALVPLAVALYPWAPAPSTAMKVAALGGVITVFVGRRRRHPLGMVLHRALTWLAFGAWPWLALTVGVSAPMVIVLGCIVLASGMTYNLFSLDEEETEVVLLTSIEPGWKAVIDRVCAIPSPGVAITAKSAWPEKNGFTLTVEGPIGSSFSFQDLRNNLGRLASAARLKSGCIPFAEEGDDHQGQALLHVPMAYSLAEVQNYPTDYELLSVNGLIPLGVFADGRIVDLTVREERTLMVSRTGGGKTNAMDVLTAGLVRCPDVLVWHLDMNNGGMATNWVLPWMQEQVDGPAIDWVAFNPEEAVLMSRAALAITLARKARYAALAQNDSRLVPLTPDLPAIVIMIDEAAEVLGFSSAYPEIQNNLMAVARMGRAVGVTMECSVLRCTGETMPVPLRKLFAHRIGLKVGEGTEFDYLFEQSRGLAPHMIKNQGEGFIHRTGAIEDDGPVKFRTYKLNPSQIVELTRAVLPCRPDLDKVSLAAAGDAYARRWDRAAGWLWSLIGQGEDCSISDQPTPEPVPTNRVLSAAERVLAQQDQEAFNDIVNNMKVEEPVRPGTVMDRPTLGPGATMVVEIVTEPMMNADIVRAVWDRGRDVTRQTVDVWLKEAIAAKRIEKGKKQGVYQPCD